MTGYEGLTAKTVGRVRDAWKQDQQLYERIFDQIDALVLRGVQAIQDGDVQLLGELMNICHGMLNALQVSNGRCFVAGCDEQPLAKDHRR